MAQPVKNACTPSNYYGGFDHTLFMGCSVMSFSTSVGWNEQVSELTVQLVRDPCAAPAGRPKHYWDGGLIERTTTAADPGFVVTSPAVGAALVGCPMYFRVGTFEFCGLLQSYEANYSESGRPTYTVKLVSPQLILEGVQLIVKEYAGSIKPLGVVIENLYNVFGFMESIGSTCANTTWMGGEFGSPAGGFGGSGANDNGMQWNSIATGFNILANSSLGAFSNFGNGRVAYRSFSGTCNYGIIPGGRYYVDISDLPSAPTYYRLAGPNVGLLESISQLCEESGYDYYVELIPIQDAGLDSTGIAKFIKIRTVRRSANPGVGLIDYFVAETSSALNSTGLQQSSVGMELRNEITSTFYFGGNKETVYQNFRAEPNCDQDDIILPYFGKDSYNNVIIPCQTELDGTKFWEFSVETVGINAQLQTIQLPDSVTITELELMFAASSYDLWENYEANAVANSRATDIGQAIADAWPKFKKQVGHLYDKVTALIAHPEYFGKLELDGGREKNILKEDTEERKMIEDLRKIHEWVNTFGTEFYGKKFSVRVPYTCIRLDNESGQVITSEVPQSDGWTDYASILGLSTSSPYMFFFRNDSGKYESFCAVQGLDGKSWESLDENSYLVLDDTLYIKSTVESDWVYGDYENRLYPRAVITIPQAISHPKYDETDDYPIDTHGLRKLFKYCYSLDDTQLDNIFKAKTGPNARAGAIALHVLLVYKSYIIDGASFGIKSNISTYGPWGYDGPAGKVRVVHDSGLVPWEYGSTTNMNTAACALAVEGVTQMQYGEKGGATVPGYPTIPLGAELGAVIDGVAGSYLVEARNASSDGYSGYTWSYFQSTIFGAWTGIYGPNVTGITTSVGSDGLSTSYQFSTYTPKFGKFAKYNAERLKKIGQNRLRLQKEFASKMLNKLLYGFIQNSSPTDRRRRLISRKHGEGHSPHDILVGEILPLNSHVYSETMDSDGTVDINGLGYSGIAFMSLDGLFRPVSMDGDGGLPRYANYNSSYDMIQSIGAMPPIYNGNCDMIVSGPWYGKNNAEPSEKIHQDYLNPFSNPAGRSRSSCPSDRSNGGTVGHDIAVCGRESGISDTEQLELTYCVNGEEEPKVDYSNDYRVLAMRGPLLLQSWGYDTDGKPIPNNADSVGATEGGYFTSSNLEGKFLSGWLKKPKTWPVGPVDLRFDRARGVWVSPPSRRQLLVTLCEVLCPNGSVQAIVNGGTHPSLYDKDGSLISSAVITVSETHGNCYPSGGVVTVYYDPYTTTYRVMEGPGLHIWTTGCSGTHMPKPGIPVQSLGLSTGLFLELTGTGDGVCCERRIRTNIRVRDISECPTGNLPVGDTVFEKLSLGYGLRASTGEPCEVKLTAGVYFRKDSDECIAHNIGATWGPLTNGVYLAGGLVGKNEGNCNVSLMAGSRFTCETSGCVTGCEIGGLSYVNNIALYPGLTANQGADLCSIKIGSVVYIKDAVDPDWKPAHHLFLGSGLTWGSDVPGGPGDAACYIHLKIDVAELKTLLGI